MVVNSDNGLLFSDYVKALLGLVNIYSYEEERKYVISCYNVLLRITIHVFFITLGYALILFMNVSLRYYIEYDS